MTNSDPQRIEDIRQRIGNKSYYETQTFENDLRWLLLENERLETVLREIREDPAIQTFAAFFGQRQNES